MTRPKQFAYAVSAAALLSAIGVNVGLIVWMVSIGRIVP